MHKLHKQKVAEELQKKDYRIHFEPWESPLDLLWWQGYKPDILAFKHSNSCRKIVLVECETRPNRKRALTKTSQIKKNLAIQKQLFENTMILPLLAIPPNNLQRIMFTSIRKFREIWIISQEGQIEHKILRAPGSVPKCYFDW